MQEIGFETPQTFKHYLNTRMRIIMPYYNAKYAAWKSLWQYRNDFYTYDEHVQESGKEYNKSDMYNATHIKNGEHHRRQTVYTILIHRRTFQV